MIVVDTGAVIEALVGSPPNRSLLARLEDDDLHAPHLIDVEFLHVVRGLVLRGVLNEDRAGDARQDFADLTITRYAHLPLLERMWQLHPDLSAYDAAFVALSEALGAPLVTTDARAARAPGHLATVELFEHL